MKVTTVNLAAKLGAVEENLKIAENYIKVASEEHSELIVLPEFFTTGFALHPAIVQGISHNGRVEQWMQEKSNLYQIAIGGSFLQYDQNTLNVYNTFGLYFPNGQSYFHRKDIPTAIENFCYTNGDEESVFETPLGRIGVVLCWEQLRWQTVRRMEGKIDFLIGGSCWWNFAPEDGEVIYNHLFQENRSLAQNAPQQLAKLLGVPFVHATISGKFIGGSCANPEIMCSRGIESKAVIIDAKGNILVSDHDTEGAYHADIEIHMLRDGITVKENKLPDDYWIPKMSEMLSQGFFHFNDSYHQYYEKMKASKNIEQ